MKVTATKPEARRILDLPTTRDVDVLVDQLVLIPYAYDSHGKPLFDIEGLRRAAAHIMNQRSGAPPA